MPDVDHFASRVQGSGLSSLVELARCNAPWDEIIRQAQLIVAKRLNQKEARGAVREVGRILVQALEEGCPSLRTFRAKFRTLAMDGPVQTIITQSAETTFLADSTQGLPLDVEEIRKQFLGQVAGDLLEGPSVEPCSRGYHAGQWPNGL